MLKNVAGQKLIVFAFDSTTNLPKTGDAANITAYVSKDFGTVTVLGDTSAAEMDATNAKGYYLFDLTQAETNADTLLFSAKSSTANIVVVGAPATVYTQLPRIRKNAALAAFPFLMTDNVNHAPATGKTVTASRSLDGALTFTNFGTVVEMANGWYKVDWAAADLNADSVAFRATASGCDDRNVTIITNP